MTYRTLVNHPHAPITLDDKIAELRREIAMRERVYPAWVASGKMAENQAKRQTAVLRVILYDYEAQAAQTNLFED
jgi:hypothetical protein